MTRALYRATVPDFLDAVDDASLGGFLAAEYDRQGWGKVSPAEERSWERSLLPLADVLRGSDLERSSVFVELFMPLTSRRCDALLTGATDDGQHAAVVVELKQWSVATLGPYKDHLVVAGRTLLHPSVQVRDYVEHLRHFHSAFTHDEAAPFALHGCALLHNMSPGRPLQLLRDPTHFGDLPKDFPVFAAHEARVFQGWLERRLLPGPGEEAADRIESGRALPSPKLLDLLVRTVQGRHEWDLLDEQKTVFFAVRSAVQIARDSGQKKVIVVRGGPGTGKSVLAIQLLADAARQHWRVVHATGSKAFQTVLQGKTIAFSTDFLKQVYGVRYKKQLPIGDLFATFANVAKVGAETEDAFDLVVSDEAHRLWERRRMKYPNGTIKWLSDEPMVRECIRASRVSAFFLDDNQSVRPGEIGHSQVIVDEARAMGVEVEEIDLNLQFRCNGSASYVNWAEGLLGFRDGNDLEWQRFEAYDAALVDDVTAEVARLRGLQADGLTCRVVAGYCWRWSKPDPLGHLVHDVTDPRFGGWSGPWIEKTGQHLKPLDHQYYKWATNPDHFEQVGSIYSAQGFEFDHVLLLWGEDLVWRDGRWVAQLDRNKDNAFKKEIRSTGADPVEKLRNVYRVLMTRGMRGTRLFVLDEETRAYVRGRLEEGLAALVG